MLYLKKKTAIFFALAVNNERKQDYPCPHNLLYDPLPHKITYANIVDFEFQKSVDFKTSTVLLFYRSSNIVEEIAHFLFFFQVGFVVPVY